jgi:hypothetical protein
MGPARAPRVGERGGAAAACGLGGQALQGCWRARLEAGAAEHMRAGPPEETLAPTSSAARRRSAA